MSKNSHNNSAVELLRFVFFLLIVSYHFSSHYLYYDESINLFCRGYLSDEFFFLITGFYLAHTALKTDKNPIIFGFSSAFERIKKIAIPYYLSWFLCFIGKNYVNEDGILVNDTCHAEWDRVLDRMIFLWRESSEETCSKKNPYERKHSEAYKKFSRRFGEFGEKLLTKEEKKGNKRRNSDLHL